MILPKESVCMKCQLILSEKQIIGLSSADFGHRAVVSVQGDHCLELIQ